MKYRIDTQFHQVRIDRWLRKEFPGIPQSLIEKYLRNKTITLNSNKVKSSHRLVEGDEILVKSAVETIESTQKPTINYSKADYLTVKEGLIFENDDYIILNKQAGFAAQGGEGVRKSIIDILKCHEPHIDYKIVHRLDKDTTGILIIAKTYIATRYFGKLFAENQIQKTYLAIVRGRLKQEQGRLIDHLLKINNMVIIDPQGKEAITDYQVLSFKNNLSLVKLNPLTGRMHQLRVQLAKLDHPIIGDVKYNPDYNMSSPLYLHAYQIEFLDLEQKPVIFKASIPKYFSDLELL